MEPVSVRYRLTEPEFISACNAHWSAHRQGTVPNVIVGLLGGAIGFALLLIAFWIAVFLIAAGALLLTIIGVRSLLWRRSFREAKKYTDDIAVVFQDDLVRVESAEGRSDLNWDFFNWYLDTPDCILLYTTKRHFSIIPKKSFQDSRSVQLVLELAGKRLIPIR